MDSVEENLVYWFGNIRAISHLLVVTHRYSNLGNAQHKTCKNTGQPKARILRNFTEKMSSCWCQIIGPVSTKITVFWRNSMQCHLDQSFSTFVGIPSGPHVSSHWMDFSHRYMSTVRTDPAIPTIYLNHSPFTKQILDVWVPFINSAFSAPCLYPRLFSKFPCTLFYHQQIELFWLTPQFSSCTCQVSFYYRWSSPSL